MGTGFHFARLRVPEAGGGHGCTTPGKVLNTTKLKHLKIVTMANLCCVYLTAIVFKSPTAQSTSSSESRVPARSPRITLNVVDGCAWNLVGNWDLMRTMKDPFYSRPPESETPA